MQLLKLADYLLREGYWRDTCVARIPILVREAFVNPERWTPPLKEVFHLLSRFVSIAPEAPNSSSSGKTFPSVFPEDKNAPNPPRAIDSDGHFQKMCPIMLELPKRSSLVTSTAASLRNGIRDGIWEEVLPGERILCEHLQVSRTTLRSALAMLVKEGWISDDARKKRRIFMPDTTPKPKISKDMVAVVTNEHIQLMAPMVIFYINEMRRYLQKIGLRVEIFTDLKLDQRPDRKLNEFLQNRQVACWVLVSPTSHVQRFFADREVPTLIVGPSAGEVRLPSISIDYRAVCRHATGVFLGRGHRRLALVIPDSKIAGNTASVEGFREGFERSARSDAEAFVLHHDSTREGICRKLDFHLKTARRATGFLVCRSLHALTVTSHLLNRGLAIPNDISVISRDSESYIDYFTPEITRYHYGRRHFAQRLSRLVVRLATDGSLPPQMTLILPNLISGKTLADAPDT